jgi:hypothetical protein
MSRDTPEEGYYAWNSGNACYFAFRLPSGQCVSYRDSGDLFRHKGSDPPGGAHLSFLVNCGWIKFSSIHPSCLGKGEIPCGGNGSLAWSDC